MPLPLDILNRSERPIHGETHGAAYRCRMKRMLLVCYSGEIVSLHATKYERGSPGGRTWSCTLTVVAGGTRKRRIPDMCSALCLWWTSPSSTVLMLNATCVEAGQPLSDGPSTVTSSYPCFRRAIRNASSPSPAATLTCTPLRSCSVTCVAIVLHYVNRWRTKERMRLSLRQRSLYA